MMKNLLFAASLLAIAPAATFAQSQTVTVNGLQKSAFYKGGTSVSAIYRAPQEVTSYELGYCNPEDKVEGVGVGQAATLHAAIYLPGGMLPTNEGATVDYINFALATTNKLSNVSIWIRKDLNSAPVYTQKIETSDLQTGWNKIMLDTPFQLDGEGIYVGYSLTTSATSGTDAFPVGTSGTDCQNGLILQIEDQGFMDYNGNGLGVLAILAGITGDVADNDAAFIGASTQKGVINTPIKISAQFFNLSNTELNDVDVKYTINGAEGTSKVSFQTPVKSREIRAVEFEIGQVAESGYYDIDLEIVKYNGNDDSNADNNKFTINEVLCMSKASPRVTVMEEGTGAWCGYCPRGAVGMEKLEELYGDKFIGIAIHSGDGMEISDYADILGVFSGFPQALMDRRTITDPYFDIELAYEACNSIPSEGSIALNAQFTDNENKVLEITSTSVFNYSSDVNPYRVAYILTEDGITGEAQSNYYSGQPGLPEDLAFLANEPSTISDYVFNDVAVGAYGCLGIEGSLEGAVKDGEEKTHTYTINMPSHIKDISKVSLIALLVTYSDQSIEIVNAAEMPLKDILGVENVSADKMGVTVEAENGQLTVRANADKALTMEVYNAAGVLAGKTEFTGNATMQLPEGNVYVVRVNDGNNVVVKKVVM